MILKIKFIAILLATIIIVPTPSLANDYTTISGYIRDAFQDELDPSHRFLVIQNDDKIFYATTKDPSLNANYVHKLIGATVKITGILDFASPPNRRYLSPTLFIEKAADIEIIEDAPNDPFDVPEIDIHTYNIPNPTEIINTGRRRISGRVCAVWGDKSLLLQHAGRHSSFSRIELSNCEAPKYGSFIEAVGYTETDLTSLNLSRAIWRETAEQILPEPAVTNISVQELFRFKGQPALNSELYSKVVRLSGTVLTVNENGRFRITDNGTSVEIDASALKDKMPQLEVGAKVEVTGVAILDLHNWKPSETFPQARNVFVVVRTADDIRILEHPSWWTPNRLLIIILMLVGGIGVIFLWNIALRKLATRRARQLFRSELRRVTQELRIQDRTRLAVELHDALSQSLTGVSMEVESAIRHGTQNPDEMIRHLSVADKILKSCRNELRNSLWDLRNDALDETDLNVSIRRTLLPHIRNISLHVRFYIPRTRLTDNATHEILRIIRELVVNAISHGGAKSIHIAGKIDGDNLLFSVSDDGSGFDPVTAPGILQGHFGLEGIRERLRQTHGTLVFKRIIDKGMKAVVTIPLPKENT